MIGPVQLVMIGTDATDMPPAVRDKITKLTDSPAVGLIDVLCLRRNRDGTIDQEPVADPAPEPPYQPGVLLGALVRKAEAAMTLTSGAPSGRGYLLGGDPIPDPQATIPLGSTVLALLLEHRWAVPLRDAVKDNAAYPVSDAWLGREVLMDLNLLPQGA
jgi:hypothetical protein